MENRIEVVIRSVIYDSNSMTGTYFVQIPRFTIYELTHLGLDSHFVFYFA